MYRTEPPSRFLKTLRELLSQPEKYDRCIKWVHSGLAIQIPDEKEFAKTVMVEVFRYSNFTSFIRQLNVYGFKKTQRKLEERIYYHPQFNKHQPELAALIKRKPRRRHYLAEHTAPPRIPRLPSLNDVLTNLRRMA